MSPRSVGVLVCVFIVFLCVFAPIVGVPESLIQAQHLKLHDGALPRFDFTFQHRGRRSRGICPVFLCIFRRVGPNRRRPPFFVGYGRYPRVPSRNPPHEGKPHAVNVPAGEDIFCSEYVRDVHFVFLLFSCCGLC